MWGSVQGQGNPYIWDSQVKSPGFYKNVFFFGVKTLYTISLYLKSLSVSLRKFDLSCFVVFTPSCSGLPHGGGINLDKCRCLKVSRLPSQLMGRNGHFWCLIHRNAFLMST